VFERRELDGMIDVDGGVHGPMDNEFFQCGKTDGEECKRADEHEKGVDNAHTRRDRAQDPFKRTIDILFANIFRGECAWIRGGVARVGGEKYTVDAA